MADVSLLLAEAPLLSGGGLPFWGAGVATRIFFSGPNLGLGSQRTSASTRASMPTAAPTQSAKALPVVHVRSSPGGCDKGPAGLVGLEGAKVIYAEAYTFEDSRGVGSNIVEVTTCGTRLGLTKML